MTERSGLSIFDETDDSTETSTLPAVAPAKPSASAPPRQSAPAPAPAPAPAASAPAASPRAESPRVSSGFPIGRRGYDTAAVDRKVGQLSSENAALARDLDGTRKRLAEVEKQLAALREQASENENPTYAGLGGRASELLRLAEEQADEVIASAKHRADELLRTASADAASMKAHASRDAEDMRMVQLKELDETRTSTMSEIEHLRSLGPGRRRRHDRLRRARRLPASPGRRAGGQRAAHRRSP